MTADKVQTQDSSQELNPLKYKRCPVPYGEDDIYISEAFQWATLVATVITLGQAPAAPPFVCASTVTQSDCRGNTDVAPLQLPLHGPCQHRFSSEFSPGSKHSPDTLLCPGTASHL